MAIERLLEIMRRLRDPAAGCPWDLEQDFRSIAPHTIEEAYEVADAIECSDMAALRDELGDLLFQVVFHAQLASESSTFGFDDVVDAICDKLTRRHPHVFGGTPVADAAEQSRVWETLKAEERRTLGQGEGALDGIPSALPALTRASKLGRRAADAGFDWPDALGPRAKIDEELAELDRVPEETGNVACLEAELGDVLFSVVNLARHLHVDPETALRRTNQRFEQRYAHLERALAARGTASRQAGPALLDELWNAAKAEIP